jgi:predicted nucleotidyltransferase
MTSLGGDVGTAAHLTDAQMAEYRVGTARLAERERVALAVREVRAWQLACQAATLLRERFAAAGVAVFGSLVHPGLFTEWSDVDLAVWGLGPEDTLHALGAVHDLSAEIELNLVDIATCRPSLLEVIEREGVSL